MKAAPLWASVAHDRDPMEARVLLRSDGERSVRKRAADAVVTAAMVVVGE